MRKVPSESARDQRAQKPLRELYTAGEQASKLSGHDVVVQTRAGAGIGFHDRD